MAETTNPTLQGGRVHGAAAPRASASTLPERAVRRHGQHAGDAPGGEGVPGQPAPGQRVDEDPQVRHRRKPEAVEAEGHRPRASGLDAARRTGSAAARSSVRRRAATRSTCRARSARSPARARSTRAPARTRSDRDRRVQLRRAEDVSASLALVGAPRRRRQEGADPHRRREAERVPERPQPAERARDAVHATSRRTTSSGRTSCSIEVGRARRRRSSRSPKRAAAPTREVETQAAAPKAAAQDREGRGEEADAHKTGEEGRQGREARPRSRRRPPRSRGEEVRAKKKGK